MRQLVWNRFRQITIGSALFALLAVCHSSAMCADPDELPVKPRDIRTVIANGKHNAFTALVRWHDKYWLSFRQADSHNSGDGDLVLLTSTDAESWTEAMRLNVVPDDRDPQFLITDDRLIWYDAGLTGTLLNTYALYTTDGETWSEPTTVYEPRFIVWKPTAVGDEYYSGAHFKSDGGGGTDRMVHLIKSTDGLNWEKVSQIRAGNWESETTLYFPKPDHCIAFLRQKYGSPQGAILESKAPFAEWTQRDSGLHLSGHCVHRINGVTYLLSRTRKGKETGTMVYLYEDDKLIPYCEIPSGGDCSYPEVVPLEDEMLVSYYSSHEGATNVYTCRIPLKQK